MSGGVSRQSRLVLAISTLLLVVSCGFAASLLASCRAELARMLELGAGTLIATLLLVGLAHVQHELSGSGPNP